MSFIELKELVVIATGWAIWDLFVFALPKDNGYFSLKTKGGLFKLDFPHHVKIITLAIIMYWNASNYFVLIVGGFMAMFIQINVYNVLSVILTKKRSK